jgi:folate-binding protein YgfZ
MQMTKAMMNASWMEFLNRSGARLENGIVRDFGDRIGELVAARDASTTTVVSPLAHLGLIDLSGEDATEFLHNQLTTDVKRLAPDSAQRTAWCTAKGRMFASFLLYREPSGYRAIVASDLASAVHKRLQMYVLRSKVKISDRSQESALIGVSGKDAEAALRAAGLAVPEKPLEVAGGTGNDAAPSPARVIRLGDTRFIVVAGEGAQELWTALAANARAVGTPVWNWLDIDAGIVHVTAATCEEFVPQMANYDKIGAVSFHKGCYPGQEIVARAQYLGRIKRHLYRLQTSAAISAGTAIVAPENPEHPWGIVANAAASPEGAYDALVVLQESYAEATSLNFGRADGPAIDLTKIVRVEA